MSELRTPHRTGGGRPYFQTLTPPCAALCPVRNDWPTLLQLVETGEAPEAARRLLAWNPFPAVLGRICPHPCESPCNRETLGGGILLHSLERYLGDLALDLGLAPAFPSTTRPPVAVVGAGPAGLAAAWFLRLLGHPVTVFEKEDLPGGVLRSEIPRHLLPPEVLDRVLREFERPGIRMVTGRALGRDFALEDLQPDHAAVVLSPGLPTPGWETLPGGLDPVVLEDADGGLGAEGAVAHAVAGAREAAWRVHLRLSGGPRQEHDPLRLRGISEEVARLEQMNRDGFPPLPPWPAGPGLDAEGARSEAARCLKCGLCTACGACAEACSRNALLWNPYEARYVVRRDTCDACGACAAACPRGALHVDPLEA